MGGKNQKKLTVGWEVLGLNEGAQRMYDEEAKEGFISEREAMYGGQKESTTRRKQRRGKLEDPENAIPDDDDAASEDPSATYTNGQCGFTLFVAQGRGTSSLGRALSAQNAEPPAVQSRRVRR
jgi:hypothetical protein